MRPLNALVLGAGLILAPPVSADAATADEASTSTSTTVPHPAELARRPDERRRDTGRSIELFGHPVHLSGAWELSLESRRNLDLSPARRDRDRLDQELKLEATMNLTNGATVFAQLLGQSEWETRRDNGPEQSRGYLERGQMWLFVPQPFDWPLDFQLGRIGLVEDRSWWWDEDLDAVRLFFGHGAWSIETGFAQRLMPVSTDEHGIDAEARDVLRWFGRGVWQWRKRHRLEVYGLHAVDHSGRPSIGATLADRDQDDADARLTWFGLRAIGEVRFDAGGRFGYWADLATVRGTETRSETSEIGDGRLRVESHQRRDVRGYGWDLGVRLSGPGPARPTVWAGWAAGSGDRDPDDGVDHAFRQTGLEENKGRFGGVKRFRYYGELVRPTLSNLSVASLGVSTRFWEKSSVDLIWHDYRQRVASDRLADTRLSADPTGEHRHLGSALELFLAFRESPAAEWTFSLSRFRAGRAFGEDAGRHAVFAELGLTINF